MLFKRLCICFCRLIIISLFYTLHTFQLFFISTEKLLQPLKEIHKIKDYHTTSMYDIICSNGLHTLIDTYRISLWELSNSNMYVKVIMPFRGV